MKMANPMQSQLQKRTVAGYLYTLPSLIIFIGFVVYPLIYGLRTSLFDWDWVAGTDKISFVGIANYIQVFKDAYFWNSLKNTVVFAVLSLAIEFLLGLGCAMLLYKIRKGSLFFRTMLIFPLTISDMVAAIMWRMMLDPSSGILNQILTGLHLPAVDWLGNPSVVIFSLVLVECWWMTGNITLILLSGLQGMPIDQLEGGRIDGANSWQIFRYLQWPHLRPFAEVALSLRLIDLLRVFAISWAITGGGPVRASEVSQLYIYTVGLGKYLNIGYSIAMAVLFSVFVMLFVGLAKRLIRVGGSR
ncbi:MAG TPA: sugar ABC transporter permease [Candidatus Cryosericum sp.]|nr:sugar ABC transporter permease [Candidatus Cryosericum sp.]